MGKKTFSFDIILQPEFSSNALVLIQEALRISNQYRINEIFKSKLITVNAKKIRSIVKQKEKRKRFNYFVC